MKTGFKTYELVASKQKSYYGKAVVCELENGVALLKSYGTVVCGVLQDGTVVRLWDGWSSTTAKHVNDFVKLFGGSAINKASWMKMEVDTEVLEDVLV